MCFSTPDPPKLPPLPAPPRVDDAAVRQRELAEAARLRAAGGTAATVRSDLAPADVQGAQTARRVKLGV